LFSHEKSFLGHEQPLFSPEKSFLIHEQGLFTTVIDRFAAIFGVFP